MNIQAGYNSKKNYIGHSPWQYKITNKFYRKISAINYAAYCHDTLYGWLLWNEKGVVMKILLKIVLDLVFLIIGFFRCLMRKKPQLHGCVAIVILYTLLFIHTPFYIWGMYKK